LRLRLAAALLLGCCATAAAEPPAISIVIDDLGDRWEESRAAAELPGAVACALLPESPYTARVAELAQRRGKEILLHLPLQPQQGRGHPLTIASDTPAAARDALLQRALRAVPQAVGVNNHQGSRLTAQADTMRWLMQALRAHGGLYFLDSRTTAATVAESMAWQQGLDATRRQVFLDAHRGPAAVRREWQRLLQLARRHGSALAIGHPFPETLALLRQELPRLQAQGVQLIAPSALIRRQGTSPGLRLAARPLQLSDALTSPAESSH
jgi:polysaccharide deacetylase 2 family uncharacterized protein YibQ